MEDKNREVTIFRGKNPEELSVYHASSLEDEIRFYINETQYVSAMEMKDDNIIIELKQEDEDENKKLKKNLSNKERFEVVLICFSMAIIVIGLFCVSLLIGSYFNSMLMYLIILNTLMFMFDVLRVILIEARTTPPCLKQKHSAEHMMVNFLEKNRRLPKSIEETKTASRFCYGCGSRKLIKSIAEEFFTKIVASISCVVASRLYLIFFNNAIVDLIIFFGVYFGVVIFFTFLLKKTDKLNFLLKPVIKVLTILAQLSNTTKKVEDDDIYLAYLAAREWMKIVYPEYYNKEQDVFIESITN